MAEEPPSPSQWGFRSWFLGGGSIAPPKPAVAKVGAGLLLRDAKGDCLLLLRRSLNNDMTWGLPGGNTETVDADLQATAFREAEEELGKLPQLRVAGSYLTTRGKRGQKHYTVFVCDIVGQEMFVPVLNHEHRESRFFSADQLRSAVRPTPFPPSPPAPLHPVVDALLTQHPTALDARK